MTKIDPALAKIAARFTRLDIEKSQGGYTLLDRRITNQAQPRNTIDIWPKPRRGASSHKLLAVGMLRATSAQKLE